jgi:hypothetical protein
MAANVVAALILAAQLLIPKAAVVADMISYTNAKSNLSLCTNNQVFVETLHATSLWVAQTYGFKAKKDA